MRLPLLVASLLALTAAPAAAAAQSAPPGTFTLEQFGELRWIEGSWRGAAQGEAAFYEGYRVVNDSTVEMTYFADSTLARSTGTAVVAFRGGRIVHEAGGAVWAVAAIDSAGWHFVPVERARNRFSWARVSDHAWTAALLNPLQGGGERTTLYRLERWPAPAGSP
jgi:hypothetical protein